MLFRSIQAQRHFLKNTGDVDLPYWIGKVVYAGLFYIYSATHIDSGFFSPGQTIGDNGDISLPFPTDAPFPLASVEMMNPTDSYLAKMPITGIVNIVLIGGEIESTLSGWRALGAIIS